MRQHRQAQDKPQNPHQNGRFVTIAMGWRVIWLSSNPEESHAKKEFPIGIELMTVPAMYCTPHVEQTRYQNNA
jgi:hypothetical protein